MNLTREQILELAKSTASATTHAVIAKREVKEQEGVGFFDYCLGNAIREFSELGENIDFSVLSRDEAISLSLAAAEACTSGYIETREITDNQGTNYFRHVYEQAIEKFGKRTDLGDKPIVLSDEEIMESSKRAAKACTQGFIKIGQIKEHESTGYYIYTFKNALTDYSRLEKHKKEVLAYHDSETARDARSLFH